MTLIKSISGIRGTIGGKPGDNLTPLDAVKFAAAYGIWLKEYSNTSDLKVVIGRDARLSGEMIQNLVVSTLVGLGIDVVDLDLSTTPTVEIAVPLENADGGIILTASHNPKQWNALKLLNEKGEFLDAAQGAKILEIAENEGWYSRGYLPHYDQGDIYQAITYRLADGLPQEYLDSLKNEINNHANLEIKLERRKAIEKLLDQGYGSCILKHKKCIKKEIC